MPCDSSYMEADSFQVKMSKVACLLDELAGIKNEPAAWEGYHRRVYPFCNREKADAMVSELCAALRDRDVTQYSLEMQIWWRDHQEADRKRQEAESRKRNPPSPETIPNGWGAIVDGRIVAIYSDSDGRPDQLIWTPTAMRHWRSEGPGADVLLRADEQQGEVI